MAKDKIKVWFDEGEDILYVSFKEGIAIDSEEVEKDIRVEYGKKGEIMGVEIHNLTQMVAKSLTSRLKEASKS